MANRARGETTLDIGGVAHTLCLTLGALAEIEALFEDGVRVDARNLVTVLGVLLRGGGSTITEAQLRAAPIDPLAAAAAISTCFETAL
ncbi:GTA-gp10 family protein [uncultured Maricaulis sp.]|uniref:GTA-gp10 family protein n=1 Tax=uncultured Maricaulis sp. TaxID=174710 RepID=UPI0030D703DF|tara:strand:- start:49715 stop:49978 length:264 start_codon:yes stop_codon:yes gene_type:complete